MVKKILVVILNLICVVVVVVAVVSSVLVYNTVKGLEIEEIEYADDPIPSVIYDQYNNVVRTINNKYPLSVEYSDLPEQFVTALICAEDARFFSHDGIDLPRLFSSLVANVTSQSYAQGGSTLTQQLIKNEYLSNEKTVKRKLQEMYLSLKLEKQYTKEEIFEAYANLILFDGITPGVNNAAHKFFDKEISEVNIVEAAMLAALVKSPTQYNPVRNPEKALERRNYVLNEMYKNGYITLNQKDAATSVSIESMLSTDQDAEETYPYQAYIDIVYEQVYDLTGYDPYSTPMKIYTFLDTELQGQLDLIQEGKDSYINITDENQQLAAAVLDNNTGAIVGVIGGKDYQGQRLFNRAYNMQRQPGSTMKPIFSYSLAVENLGWNSAYTVTDEPYTYPGTNISVSNVDGVYMGELTIEQALGYSRNTVALSTLQKVIDKIGLNKTIKHLENIGLLDCEYEDFNMSYGLGGMINGISPVQLAAAYRILPGKGEYVNPTTIKKVEIIGEDTIENERVYQPVISKETAFIMSDVLKEVINNNYWGIGSLRLSNRDIAAKTGTTDFDNPGAFGYPSNASKDIWYAGFCRDYTITVWTGFDKAEIGEMNYFKAGGDNARIGIAKRTFSRIMQMKSRSGTYFSQPDTLTKVNVVRGVYPYLLPDQYTPSSMIESAYFRRNQIPTESIQPDELPNLGQVNAIRFRDKVKLIFPLLTNLYNEKEYGQKLYSNEMIYGKIQYCVQIKSDKDETIVRSDSNIVDVDLKKNRTYYLQCYYSYEKGDFTSNYYTLVLRL